MLTNLLHAGGRIMKAVSSHLSFHAHVLQTIDPRPMACRTKVALSYEVHIPHDKLLTCITARKFISTFTLKLVAIVDSMRAV